MTDRPTIIFSTNHPAPYMDRLFEAFSEKYNVQVIYARTDTGDKEWSPNLQFFSGQPANTLTSKDIKKMVADAKFLVVGGWGMAIHRKLIIEALTQKKAFSIFSDAPDEDRKNWFVRRLQSFLLQRIPLFFVSGEAAGERFRKTYKISKEKIKNFPYFPSFVPGGEAIINNENRRRLLLSENKPVQIFIANRFIERKGYEVVLDALDHIAKMNELERFEIKIAGTGPLFEHFKFALSSVCETISFLGWVSPERYLEELENSDVLIHASHFEPYGIPPVEAFLLGKLVIASKGVFSALDLAECSEKVRLFEVGDGVGLGEAMLNLALESKLMMNEDIIRPNCSKIAPVPNFQAISEVCG